MDNLPKVINVVGIEYTVEEKDFIEINDNRNYQGKCTYDTTEIQLMKTLSKTKKEQVLVHEMLHAIFHEANVPDELHTEELICNISNVLYQVLKDNRIYFGPATTDNKKHTKITFMEELIDKIEACDYSCEAGPLKNNMDFISLKNIIKVR